MQKIRRSPIIGAVKGVKTEFIKREAHDIGLCL